MPEIESHPLEPFLPANASLLMLGSFPPPRKRWSMDFFYPNLQNDMWRIFGHLFFNDKNHFLLPDKASFCKEEIVTFLQEKGIALFDAATVVRRLQGNASDKFLEIIEPTDIRLLLKQLPQCQAIAATGQKAIDTIRLQVDADEPSVGRKVPFSFEDRDMHLYRMPSSSRAYPLALEKKAEYYLSMFKDLGIY
jgi:G:T/U-mismatch repair DNA glycosylase